MNTHWRNIFAGFLTGMAVLSAPLATADDEQMLPIWQVEGGQNRIFLLGSIHLLRE